jgi:mono/diheme cytochrome c family protein
MGRNLLACTGVFLILAAIPACGEARGGASAKGGEIYRSQACATCHGQEGAGTSFGPTLHGKKGFWTRAALVEYLKDPAAYSQKDPRLSAQAKKFTLPMQRFDKLSPEDLEAVADHVLAMP